MEQRVGPLVSVVVARSELEAGQKLDERTVKRRLSVRQVPGRFVPPDSFASPRDLVGLSTLTQVPSGGYVTAAQLERGGRPQADRSGLGRGERAVEVAVAGAPAVAGGASAGSRVDVLVTSEGRAGSGRSFIALEDVPLLDVRSRAPNAAGADAPTTDGAGARAAAVATLRVSVRQAVFLTAAQNFAREVRLLARSPTDRARVGPQTVEAAGL